jgi:hypothetical protein
VGVGEIAEPLDGAEAAPRGRVDYLDAPGGPLDDDARLCSTAYVTNESLNSFVEFSASPLPRGYFPLPTPWST